MAQGRITWWLLLGTGLGLASGAAARGAPPAVEPRFYNNRSFRVPVDIPPADAHRYKQVNLCASTNRGKTWTKIAATTPDRPLFSYKSASDGEVWFAAQVVDQQGRLFPSTTADIVPNMKVIIDTRKPTLTIEPRARRGTEASIAWDATDENVDLETLTFDFLPSGSTKWVPIPLPKPARLGLESWDAGTAEPVQVRGVVYDKAKNRQVVVLNLPGGGFADEAVNPPVDAPNSTVPPPLGTFTSREASRPVAAGPDASKPDPTPADGGSGDGGNVSSYDPFSDPNSQRTGGFAGAAPGGPASPPIVVASPKFSLAYAVEDAGPSGPALVELYTTHDGGQTWENRGTDPDRTSPFDVDLHGEGRFGLKLVAKSAADQGDKPPVPGEAPRTVVDVDSSGPVVTLNKPQVDGNTLILTWRSEDAHPSPSGVRSVMISVRAADTPNARWQVVTPSALENSGQFRWQIPARCPAKIQVRIDIRDDLNNLGSAETPAESPVLVDLSKPKSRIIGLDRTNSRR